MGTRRLRDIGIVVLLVGALLVGGAIVMDGDASRIVNGVGGVLWFSATVLLTFVAVRHRPQAWVWIVLAVLTVSVAFVVKPSAWLPTLVGFVPAGVVMGWLAPRPKLLWSALVPAWYLPAHIGTAVLMSAMRSVMGREAALRTDPPPTAAFVPLLMVVCALVGGMLAQRFIGEPGSRNVEPEQRVTR